MYGALREKVAAYELCPFISLVRLTQLLASDPDVPWDDIRIHEGAAHSVRWQFAVIRRVVTERKGGSAGPWTGAGLLTPPPSPVRPVSPGPSAFRPWRTAVK